MPTETFPFAIIAVAVVMIVGHLVRLWRTAMHHRTLREAILRGGDALAPLLREGLEPPAPAYNDGRNGLLLVTLATALVTFGLIQGDADDIRNLSGAAVFPGVAGIALLGRAWWARTRG